MRKIPLLFTGIVLLVGCSYRLVTPYDEVLDKGVTEFAEQLNSHVKNMADLGGKPEGTYDANVSTYNALDSKLNLLIDRATAESNGTGCKLEGKLLDQLHKKLGDKIPSVLVGGVASNDSGCNERLLVLVKLQLAEIENIHKSLDKCGTGNVSCLRPATSKSALDITNQSIRAVLIVEAAKRKGDQ
jgi:hypothetical protein